MPRAARRTAAALALSLSLLPAAVPSAAAGPADTDLAGTDTAVASTDALSAATRREARRVDAVPTPVLDWQPCDLGECATAQLPLDYDDPTGPTVTVALTRIRARHPEQRIGSLFLNPGGPGATGTDFPQRALAWLGDDVRDRFDLIGFDPRGTHQSTTTQCFHSRTRLDAVTGLMTGMRFPVTAEEQAQYLAASGALARACSTQGRTIVSAVSTAEVARDLDVLRRAVGDARLNYLGFSYGTYLGSLYATMFPGRVRALAIDGVVDPREWVGSDATANIPMSVRMDSASGAEAALTELLRRCREAGDACGVAQPEQLLESVSARLKHQPLVFDGPDGPETLTYQGFIETVLYALYNQESVESVPALIQTVDQMLNPTPSAMAATAGADYVRQARRVARASATRYDNSVEQVPAIMCTDSRNPWDPATWSRLAPSEAARAPHFGLHFLWGSAPCAGKYWWAHDEDAWPGPFDSVTAAPVLVVGSFHDPATNYHAAVTTAGLMPRARLLSSNNWGHTAYGISACATAWTDQYLVRGTLPPAGTVCTDGRQPFQR